ncbi:siaz-interacting nuclear protein [Danio aesculapii]|uniref:siaz-interacting nuclear protein n=1 Tax=Danio aesculapii TaxID=1142201 RepID=UPI0024BFA454|nr:siaz-interacting nuclear protein [Danio aesculapii]
MVTILFLLLTVSFTDLHSETDKNYISVFKRKSPLTFSPKRKYAVAVVSPLQKHDSSETVIADGRSGSSFAAHAVRLHECVRLQRLTSFKPFSFDARDAARKVERERKMKEMRQIQEQVCCSSFRAHPVRRYKPLSRPAILLKWCWVIVLRFGKSQPVLHLCRCLHGAFCPLTIFKFDPKKHWLENEPEMRQVTQGKMRNGKSPYCRNWLQDERRGAKEEITMGGAGHKDNKAVYLWFDHDNHLEQKQGHCTPLHFWHVLSMAIAVIKG